jgi:uncharacterized protein YydD (DUF2326 family)
MTAKRLDRLEKDVEGVSVSVRDLAVEMRASSVEMRKAVEVIREGFVKLAVQAEQNHEIRADVRKIMTVITPAQNERIAKITQINVFVSAVLIALMTGSIGSVMIMLKGSAGAAAG